MDLEIENKSVSSPYYPQEHFVDGDVCEWLITAPEGSIIFLEFDHLNVSEKKLLVRRNGISIQLKPTLLMEGLQVLKF